MQLNAEQLVLHLQKHLAPLYAISGNETLLVIETADLIRRHVRQEGFSEYELFTVDQHFRWSNLLNAGANLSLFGDKKLIDIRIPSGKPGKEGGKAIESYCESLPQDTVTLLTLPKLDRQSQSTQWFKTIEQAGVHIPVHTVGHAQLPAWIRQRLAAQRQTVDTETLNFIVHQIEGNLLAAHQEIQKLALLYPQDKLSFDQVKNAILNVARYDLYQLGEAMVTFNPARFIQILKGLKDEGAAPPLILTVLTEQIRQLILLRKGLDKGISPQQLFKTMRIWGNRQHILMTAAKSISIERSQQYLVHAAKIDRINKGVSATRSDSVWEELLQLGLSIALKSQAEHSSLQQIG